MNDFIDFSWLCIKDFKNEFYDQYEDWIYQTNGVCKTLMNKLFIRGINPDIAATIIERYHRRYI
jgi:hypothetical protein